MTVRYDDGSWDARPLPQPLDKDLSRPTENMVRSQRAGASALTPGTPLIHDRGEANRVPKIFMI